ncbi:MAG TPA: hypothetical protein VFA07_19705 [Chthonomonadaceae bacterium]|nr:hypothetical protein [Chthonomonadaceae bacterium]
MKVCPVCHKKVPNAASVCPHCTMYDWPVAAGGRARVESSPDTAISLSRLLALLLVMLFIVVGMVAYAYTIIGMSPYRIVSPFPLRVERIKPQSRSYSP